MKDAKEFRKNQFSSNIFTFLIVTHQNFEDNLRILANFAKFSRKNSKIYLFRPYVFKKVVFFFVYFNEDYIFYTKNLFIRPKIGFKAFFTTKDAKSFVKINFLVTFLPLSITPHNFEINLRILANIEKFSRKNLKICGFCQYVFKKL